MSKVIKFPSGLEVEMKGESISSMKKTYENCQKGIVKAFTGILDKCTVKLVSTGIYPDDIKSFDDRVNWSKALSDDRMFGLVEIRKLSFASQEGKYEFQMACHHCPSTFIWTADLEPEPNGDLLTYEMPEESQDVFKSGSLFEDEFAGKIIKWSPLLGEQEAILEKLGKSNPDLDTDDMSMNLMIKEISGLHTNDKMKWIQRLGDEKEELQDMMAERVCGLDLTVEVHCPHCKMKYDAALPFGVDFWVPLKKVRSRRRERLRRARGLSI
jgi:hypothetical protein